MYLKWIIFICLLVCICGPPVVDKKKVDKDQADEGMDEESLEYSRYLQEVVNVLESHPEFKKKLETENPEYIKSGKIADHLDEMLPNDLRNRLSEIKLREIERLRELYRKKFEAEGGGANLAPPEHIDHTNLRSFEKDDLKKLIQKTTRDLEMLDKRRTEEFKQYEMKKELERRRKLGAVRDEAERQKLQKEYEEKQRSHKEHPKLHHPGSKDQLEEVWEEVDDLPKDNFDPKTFFALHDLDGNGKWDEMELESLFQQELDKVYNESDSNDDPREREEEMERMRSHVMQQMDKDGDRHISLEEFIEDTKTEDYNKDEGWETLDQKEIYSPEEYQRYQEEMARRNGWEMPPSGYPAFYPPDGYVGQPQPHAQGQPQGHVPAGAPQHPPAGQVPGRQQQHQVVPPQAQVHAGQRPPDSEQVHVQQQQAHQQQIPDQRLPHAPPAQAQGRQQVPPAQQPHQGAPQQQHQQVPHQGAAQQQHPGQAGSDY